MLQISDTRPGDVLLCRAGPEFSKGTPVRKRIEEETGSPYTHAAILLSGSEVADARPVHGVSIRPLMELLREVGHVAVLRRPEAWNTERIDGLRDYAAALQALGAGYNYKDALRYAKNKATHEANVMDSLEQHFSQGQPAAPTDFGPFFCSELVAACFVNSGFIEPGAAIVLAPGKFAPGDLAQEPTFGLLVGFLVRDASVEVPTDDPLRPLAKFHDIYGK